MEFSQIAQLTEDEAREYLESLRWPNGPECPHCGSDKANKLEGKATRPGVYKCKNRECRKQFTVTVQTIFHRSHISIKTWVMAFAIVCASKKGVSALQLQRMLGLRSYKSAWHMAHRIRHAMQNEPLRTMLSGTVEVDEVYIGGRKKGVGPGLRPQFRTPVVALVERNGNMRTKVVDRVTTRNLRQAIDEVVDKKRSRLVTDELKQYRTIGRTFAFGHGTVRHASGEYARGSSHVNSAESFFALLRRGIHGSYHHVGKQHLQRYSDEFAFRWNHREASDSARTESALRLAPNCRLTYRPIGR